MDREMTARGLGEDGLKKPEPAEDGWLERGIVNLFGFPFDIKNWKDFHEWSAKRREKARLCREWSSKRGKNGDAEID